MCRVLTFKLEEMKKDEKIIRNDLTEKKCFEVAKAIDGLKLPEVLAILSTVIIELVYCARQEGVDVREIMAGWLKGLAKSVLKRDYSEFDKNEDVWDGKMLN